MSIADAPLPPTVKGERKVTILHVFVHLYPYLHVDLENIS